MDWVKKIIVTPPCLGYPNQKKTPQFVQGGVDKAKSDPMYARYGGFQESLHFLNIDFCRGTGGHRVISNIWPSLVVTLCG